MIEYFIKNIIFIVLTAIDVFAFKLIIYKTKFKKPYDGSGILRYPLPYRLAPLTSLAYFVVVTAAILIFGDIKGDYLYLIAAGVVVAVSLSFIIFWSIWKVAFDDNSVTYTGFFGKTRRFEYGEIELKKDYGQFGCSFYKAGEKVFDLPGFIQNGDMLVKAYQKNREVDNIT